MTHRYNVFVREHQIVRFSIEVETGEDVRGAILEPPAGNTNTAARNGQRERRSRSTIGKSLRSMNSTPTPARSRSHSTLSP
jgi:hypothetical protein